MSSRGYKPRQLFRRTMLARVTKIQSNDTECEDDSQGNSLAAGVEQVSDDVELTAENLHRPRSDRRCCTWSTQQVKREKKSGQSSRLFGEKGKEMGMDARSRRGIAKIHQRVQNQMRIQRRGLRSWSVGHVHWSSPVLGCSFHTRLWAWILRWPCG